MTSTLFNDDWSVRRKVSGFVDLMGGSESTAVTLPHDAMIGLPRSVADSEGPSTGYFPGGVVEYRKRFEVPVEWRQRRVAVEFEGVYRDAMIFVNDEFAGQWRGGYATFRLSIDTHLRYGVENVIRVEARAHQDSRWYSGLGIYRDVHLVVVPLTHLVDDTVRVTTPDVDDERAVVETAVTIRNDDVVTRRMQLETTVLDESRQVLARRRQPVTLAPSSSAVLRGRSYVYAPRRWGVEDPHLYRLRMNLRPLDEPEDTDSVETSFGIRTIRIDPTHGLRINDVPVLLRGACVHHDNGPLGSATIRRAEERRVELLKAAGFNAIRSAHNALSPAMLHACDRLGMLVFDEAFDAWTEMNKAFDATLDFPEWWKREIDAMVRKDFNHPSVILYSIGNEIHEYGSGSGAAQARAIAERIRALDSTRFLTTAVSGFWAVAADVVEDLKSRISDARARGVNDVMNDMSAFFQEVTDSDMVTQRTEEAHAAVDVAGLNYAESRYGADHERFPDRVMLGTETNPRDTARSWRLTVDAPHVLGAFTWTGWDYLGEAGLGRTDYTDDPEERGGGDPEFPWLTSWAGDIDITGHRRPISYYRETVFGLRHVPYIAVLRPERYGQRRLEMQWAWVDAVSSWSWSVPAGSPVEIEVYSDADEVELLLNDEAIGRKPAGALHDHLARFETHYRPGTLTAVGYVNGVEQGRTLLRTARDPDLAVTVDRSVIRADSTDAAYVAIEFRDIAGNLAVADDRPVRVVVEGPAVLAALGSARPATEERFDQPTCTTFDGRALAIIRPTGPGTITVRVSAEGSAEQVIEIEAGEPVASTTN